MERTSPREYAAKRAGLLGQAREMIERAEGESRDFNTSEATVYQGLLAEADRCSLEIRKLETIPPDLLAMNRRAPSYNQFGRGDSEERALSHYFRKGDKAAMANTLVQEDDGTFHYDIQLPTIQSRAVDSTMNITTAADGQNAVPTGLANSIAARRNEIDLITRLRLRSVPGKGTTVNFPYENADPVVLATTAEQADNHANNYERDTPVLGSKAFTLVKKTKKLELTEELMDDEDANLMAFIGDHIGRAVGLTHNAMLLTEVASNGTALKTFASATVIAAGEPEAMVFNDTIGYYFDDGGSIGWVMRPTTFGEIKNLTGDVRLYDDQTGGSGGQSLLQYPVIFSNSAGLTAASAKSMYFGNWYYVGYRTDDMLRLTRDNLSVDGLVILKYRFRACFGVLIAGAVGYGGHPSA